MNKRVFESDYEDFLGLPPKESLFNPLTDVYSHQKEDSELTEFYKLCSEYYSPAFGIKYLLNVRLFPYQISTILCMLKYKFPMLLFTRGGGKSFLLAVFGLIGV